LHGCEKKKRGRVTKNIEGDKAAALALACKEAEKQEVIQELIDLPLMSNAACDEEYPVCRAVMVTMTNTIDLQRDMQQPGFFYRMVYALLTDDYQVCCV
jgi:hypothetical protein